MTKVRRNKKANPRWARTKVLIIDEGTEFVLSLFLWVDHSLVSMIDGDLFDKLEEIGRRMRKSKDPFGGIQVRQLAQLSSLVSCPVAGRCHWRFLPVTPRYKG